MERATGTPGSRRQLHGPFKAAVERRAKFGTVVMSGEIRRRPAELDTERHQYDLTRLDQ